MQFCKGGTIKIREFHSEISDQYDVKRDGKEWIAVKEDTGEIVRRAKTRDEISEMFWMTLENPEGIIRYAADSAITFEEGLTVGDIFDIIENNDEIEEFVTTFWPFWETYNPTQIPVDKLVVKCTTEIENDTIHVNYHSNFYPTQDYRDLPVVLEKTATVYKNGEFVFDGETRFRLFDVLKALFGDAGMHIQKPIILSKSGLVNDLGEPIANPMVYLLQPCELSEDFTLGDLFANVKEHDELVDFIRNYDRCNVDAFHAEALIPPEPDDFVEKIHFLIVSGEVSRDSYGKKEWFLNVSVDDVIGYGDISEQSLELYKESGREIPQYDRYGISMSPINSVAHLPLRLNHEVEIYQAPVYSHTKKDFKKIESEKTFGKFNYIYTLLDILHSVYWDISFYGSPVDRDEMKDDLHERMEDYNRQKEEGTLETFSLDEVFEEWDLDKEFDEEE